ncbi:hypothetical protein JCGZ_04967 [Jatropha curcas]|uniref:Protein phosphatase n=1 Tax=Jatropha curcas TaxID=180498 RepID=A0A067L2T8_JATCU|nr:probable protein phosphatase 2C 55 [Jatropha curcas]KDP38810.1 hypothetical protein JCGZ_04967 [Jatropha curcas]
MIVKRRKVEGHVELSIVTKCDENNIDYFHKKDDQTLKMNAGAFYLPKDDKERPQGEDAHFICKEKLTIGVADGVGGWARKGVDAGIYARRLMENSIIALQGEKKGSVNPRKVLQEAYSNTNVKGSSTACIITIDSNNCLHYVNLGDSGFLLFRENKYIYKSKVQQHEFNHPYQLGTCSDDLPCLAYEEKILVEAGDIVVAGTDGLLDNIYPSEITKILEKADGKNEVSAEELAWRIVERALFNSVDEEYHSPFAREAEMAGYLHTGGKYDDITVIVCQFK